MRKLTPRGIIGLTTTAFLFFILTSLIYFNDQVEFNAIEAKWDLNEQYIQRDEIPAETSLQDINYLSFDGVNDYVDVGTLGNWFSQNANNFTLEITFSSSFDDSFDTYPYGTINSDLLNYFQLSIRGQGDRSLFALRDSDGKREFVHFPSNILLDENINKLEYSYNNGITNIKVNDITQSITYMFNENPLNFDDFEYPFLIGARNIAGNISSFSAMELYDFKIYNGSTLFLHYDMTVSNNQLIDQVGNNNADIYGATVLTLGQEEIIVVPTQSAIDSYQVFENIRNNASTVNPLGFMNTLVSIPAQAVGYYDAFTDFVTGGFGIFDIPDMTFSELADTWWARLPIIYDKFNERYGPLGD